MEGERMEERGTNEQESKDEDSLDRESRVFPHRS